ncbi:hypothetical protein [Methylocapsa palsarum]|uniref:Cytochrome C n=1 Tax=Methylocapsa palsarum TaxID=1612308 RepID=A0A1I3XH49_9HYPH|nr:hypothetical protein [Methylocapsa palsarum]SFK18894.1 hypothetical protein SAMN05444581_103129 [Methylocapsa palsarum]
MKRLAIIFLTAAAAAPALADDVPFAEPFQKANAAPGGLADLMMMTQWRHIKTWYAIKRKNWDLLDYELGKLADTIERAAMLYQNIPVEFIEGAVKPLNAMRKAISEKNIAKVEIGFADLTAACNACHRAAQIGFVTIQTPTSLPFSDQKFLPPQQSVK